MKTQTPPSTSGLRYLKGIGPKRALALERLGVRSLRDLLYLFPRRYEDRSRFRKIADLAPGDVSTVRGEILAIRLKPIRRMPILEVVVGDDTGTVHAVWFNQAYLKNQFSVGQNIILFGRIDLYQRRLQIASPEYETIETEEDPVHTGRITPIYPLTEGLFQRSLRTTLKEVVQNQLEKTVSEYLPESFRSEKGLMGLNTAVREMHFPTSFDKQREARRRIVFDEFLIFELMLLRKIQHLKTKYQALALGADRHILEAFRTSLPFPLTASQRKAMEEIFQDISQTVPMNRLLQGDVGSGKTVVAAFALMAAAKTGHQGVLLVPTEILAEQHFRTLQGLLAGFGIRVALLTKSTPDVRREKLAAELGQNKCPVVVGTHALLQEDIRFASLALVIIDEQHKFGVHQRCRLLNAEPRPHQLVMTATPIPRTLALTVYGDLDVSVMKDMPQGRRPIQTYWITRKKQDAVLEHILGKTGQGEQAYFIFPLIEETEKLDLLAAKREFERLRSTVFRNVPMGLVHGRLAPEDREAVMRAFKGGELKILIATSVVEVGVDNPNATMMVIENAERFGLAQLHQMRGRIGRGNKASQCFLFGEPKTEEGKKRLRILTKTQDGFVIAEEDLKLRGPGDFWGTRQSGEPLFRLAHPLLDQEILLDARNAAMHLVTGGSLEHAPEWQSLNQFLDASTLRY